MICPDLDTVKRLVHENENTVIPVYKSILADTETPVSVWLKLFKKEKYSFLLESVTGGDTVARYSFIGGNPFALFRSRGENWVFTGESTQHGTRDPIGALRKILAQFKPAVINGLPRFSGGAVGFLSYDSVRLWESIPDKNPKQDSLDDIHFAFYKDIIAFDNREHRLLLISNIIPIRTDSIEQCYDHAVASIQAMEKGLETGLVSPAISIAVTGELQSNFTRESYERAVEQCKEYIRAGDIFQVVLSQRFTIPVQADPFDLYRMLRVVNPSPYMYFYNLDKLAVVGASPEMLVRVEDGVVENRPIAGTRKRGRSEEEDSALIQELLDDPKECAEHIMLVDLGRNDIGRVSDYGSVQVEELMHVEKYSHVMHIVSNVSGKLRKECDVFDALFSCFPAGTLSGAPKIRAMEIIDELEPVRRGIYGGALGYIGFDGAMDTCIVIRTMVYDGEKAVMQAGAGIVADSVPEREYNETLDKAGALFKTLKTRM